MPGYVEDFVHLQWREFSSGVGQSGNSRPLNSLYAKLILQRRFTGAYRTICRKTLFQDSSIRPYRTSYTLYRFERISFFVKR